MKSMKKWLRFVFLILLVSLSGINAAETGKPVYHVLFIGNSYTYYHSMPQMFKAISEHAFSKNRVETKFVGGGGATLKKHWEVGQALVEIKTGHWDYVVLQEQSMLGSQDLTDPDSPKQFFKYARLFDLQIKKSGAKTVFFMTWSRRLLKNQQKYLTDAYLTIAKELGSKVAPVGMVWERIRENPKIELYMDDGSHPSIAGSFLAALTLSAVIFHAVPEKVPGDLYGYEILRGGTLAAHKSRLCHLPYEAVQTIRDTVAHILSQRR